MQPRDRFPNGKSLARRQRAARSRRRSSQRVTLALLLSGMVLLLGCQTGEPAPAGEPQFSALEELQSRLPTQVDANVIVISFDALRADVLGSYGYPLETSPELDAFAAKSIVFEQAYTASPVTPTSFAAAFTGLLPHRVFHAWDLVYTDTLAQRFSDQGYSTAAFLNNVQLASERHFDTGFDTYHYAATREKVIIEKSLKWLEEHREDRVFAWIHFISPHSPYDYRKMASHLYDESYEGEFLKTTGGRFETDDPKDIARIRSLYDGEVFFADWLFSQVLEGLEQQGYLENSIIVVTSDHGEEFKEHGGFQHDRLTEEHVHIPLILYHPQLQSSLRTGILASNLDFFPTLLSMTGIEFEGQLDGRDLTKISEEPSWTASISMLGAKKRWVSLRRDQHKLIQMCIPEQTQQLFDLATDTKELHDLHQEQPGLARELLRELGVVFGGSPCQLVRDAMQGKGPTVGLSEENIEALRALGYLGD